ncbi:MAG: enoyl-CoA hydratase-related protein [Desulfarculaceae bacterium]|jgi:enoyl-CoA hydratase/carnithine racemase
MGENVVTLDQQGGVALVRLNNPPVNSLSGRVLEGLESEEILRRAKRVYDGMEAFTIPIIAAISGVCLGGGLELALACHIRIADEKARLGFPEINLALMPGAGGTQRLARLAGFSRSCELILTGDLISAGRAYSLGLVDRVAPPGKCLNIAEVLAQAISEKSRAAVISALEAIKCALRLPAQEGMEKETRLFGELFDSAEAQEKIKAFLKRQKA